MSQLIKKIFLFIFLLLIVSSIFIIKYKINQRLTKPFSYAYLISNNYLNQKEKSSLIIVDKEGKILKKKNLYNQIYNKIIINNSTIETYGEDFERNISYTYKYNSLYELNMGNSPSNSPCTGSSNFMFKINEETGYIINYGYVDKDKYMYYVKTHNNCYEVPLVMNQFNYDNKNNILNIEGYEYSKIDVEGEKQAEYMRYQIDIYKGKITKIKIENQEDYTPSIGSQQLESYIKDNFVYTVIQYFSKENNTSSIYLVKKDLKTYEILEKKLIEEKGNNFDNLNDQNNNIIFLFEDLNLYYLRYDNGINYLDIYDLNFNLKNTILINNTGIKFHPNLIKIKDEKLHYLEEKETGITHRILNIKNGKEEKINIKFKYKTNQRLKSFDIND